jgi:3-deoxy-D-manno-octulosonic-acid transferase
MLQGRIFYRFLVGVARFAAPILATGTGKISRGFEGRLVAHQVLAKWGEEKRDPHRPTVWVHAPSVGESVQACAVIDALRARFPGVQVVFTHFSPSAAEFTGRMPVEVSAYLPWDLRGTTGRVLEAVQPDLLIFSKTEVWPVLVDEAQKRSIPVALVGGSVPSNAGRLRQPMRTFLRATWQGLASACAIADADAHLLQSLGVFPGVISVTGDPAVDAIAQRVSAADAAAPHLAPFYSDHRPTVIAGSTWNPDLRRLLVALEIVRRVVGEVRVVIAPHEPSERGVTNLREWLEKKSWSTRTLEEVESSGSVTSVDAIIIDRVGVLPDLYTVGHVAYVGGGFHRAGVHSVIEPAAARLPVIFGPQYRNSSAAIDLLKEGAAKVITDAEGLADSLLGWLEDTKEHGYAANCAFGYIQTHRGGAERTVDALAHLLPPQVL